MVVTFGTLFNDIEIVRYTQAGAPKEKLKVPLSYGSKERYLTRLTSNPNLIKTINVLVPRMSFNLDSLEYDTSRKQISTIKNFSAASNTQTNTQYVPVPYNFEFSLSIYVRNIEDGTQILEQILPFFTPDFNVTVDFVPSMDQKYDMPVLLTSVANEVDYEGDMLSTRLIIWNLEFTAKSYIWPPVKSGKIIRQANTSIYIDTQSRTSQKVFVDKANGSGYFADEETIFVTARDVAGDVSYFSNSNTGILVISNLNKLLQANDVVVGATSNASYTVTSVDTNPLRAVLIITTPDPITANVDDEFGFSETISEWPNT
jgi:hypothetical protein